MAGSRQELLETFLRLGFLAPEALKAAEARGSRTGASLLEATLAAGDLHPDAKSWLLAEALGLPFLEIDPESVRVELADLVPEWIARDSVLAPISRDDGRLTLAVTDPFCLKVFALIEELAGLPVRLVVAPRRAVAGIIDRFYPDPLPVSAEDLSGGGIDAEEAAEWLTRGRGRRFAENVLLRASAAAMSGVRVYPEGRSVLLAGQGAGEATVLLALPLRQRDAVVAAFRAVAGLKATGAAGNDVVFHVDSAAGVRSFRANFLSGISGPEVVVKVLPDRQASAALDYLGLAPEQLDVTRRVLGKGDGFCLFSSPGNEGVASTLFAMLRETGRPDRRVVTVEEQFRFRTERYIQLERRDAEARFGRNWARLVESLDPQVLLIDHVADHAELEDLVLIAQAGVLVLCGIRTFGIEDALRTLLGAHVDPFVLARATRLVMHQRLVKLLCPDCRRQVPAKPNVGIASGRHRAELEAIVEEASFYVPSGCPKCRETGYAGKLALFELLPFTPAVQSVVSFRSSAAETVGELLGDDFLPAVLPAQDLLRRGMATYDDVRPFFR